MTELLIRPRLAFVKSGQTGTGPVAYLIQYFQGGNLVGSSTAAGPLSQVSKAAEKAMHRRDADAVKVFDGVPIDAVWSKDRSAR